jgi:phenylacetate-CoA ligase
MRMYNPAIEGLTRDKLLDLQLRKLRYQLDYLYASNPFYRDRLKAAKVHPDDVKSVDAFRQLVPTSEKQDFLADQRACPPYGTRLGVGEDQVVMSFLTSGTSGVGQEAYGHTWSDALLAGSQHLEAPLWWCGLHKGDRVYSLTPVATLAFGLIVQESMRLAGYQPVQAFVMDSPTKLDLMRRFPPAALIATPAHFARLTTIARDLGIDPKIDFAGLKGLLTAGQSYPVELAQRMEEVWGARLYETYGSSQGNGHMAATCERGAVTADGTRGGMHIYDHHYLFEVIDPDSGEHVEPGEEGMAVLTTLDLEASPVLRFLTYDKVRYLGEGCPCGRPWAMIEAGTMARYDDMVKVRGMNIWPQLVDDVVFGHDEIDEYTADITVDDNSLEQIDLRYALRPSVSLAGDALTAVLTAELKAKTNVTFRVAEVPRSQLPVFEFKAVRWNDRRQADLQKKVW